MRLILLNYEYPPLGGGAGNATAHIAREMAAQGAHPLVVTSAFGRMPRRERLDGFDLVRIPTLRRREERCTPAEMAVFLASACLALPGLAARHRARAVLAFFGVPCGPAAWVCKALRGLPYAVSLRGGDVPGFQPYDLATMHRLTGPLIRFLWRRAGAVVANSNGLADLARRFEPGLDYPVIPNGADTALFTPRPGRRAPGPLNIGFHGRLVHQKGLDLLLNALAQLPPDTPDWRLHLAGDGPQRPELAALAGHLGLAERVTFHGWTRRPDLARLLADMDLYAFPSRDEGMPNAVLEAMAAGLPVAASRIAGSEELVEHGRTGLLFEPEDAPGLSRALGRLLADADLRRDMGAAGRLRVEERYSWASTARAYLNLMERIAGGQTCAA